MPVNVEKQRFVRAMQATATLLARVKKEFEDQFETYQARGYGSGGADPITDADIVDTQVTAAEVAEGWTLAENLPKFIDNNTPFASDYDLTIAKLRTDI